MDISKKTIWQQAAGDTDRNYAELCLKWGVILNGPGYAGKWPDCEALLRNNEISSKKISDLKRFAEKMQDGNLVVLRSGTASVLGVGQIVGSYEWNDEFGDIDGWNLEHVRRVRWLWKGQKEFDTYALKLGDTTQELNIGPVTEWLSKLVVPDKAFSAPLPKLPVSVGNTDIPVEAISEFLFDHGVASSSITHLLQEIGELTRIAKWYQQSEGKPSEHETVAYLVVPLLRALGWTPQRMAVEWNRVDVALFEQLPRSEHPSGCCRSQKDGQLLPHRIFAGNDIRGQKFRVPSSDCYRWHSLWHIHSQGRRTFQTLCVYESGSATTRLPCLWMQGSKRCSSCDGSRMEGK